MIELSLQRKAERQTSGSKGTPNKGTLGVGKREKREGMRKFRSFQKRNGHNRFYTFPLK